MEIEQNHEYLLNPLFDGFNRLMFWNKGGLDKSSPYDQCGFDKLEPNDKGGLDKSSPYMQCGSDKLEPSNKGGLDESSRYNQCTIDKSSPHDRQGKRIVFFLILSAVFSLNAFTETKRNKTSIGFLIGDPVALSFRVPITQKNYLNISGGIWAWHFWEEPHYNTGILTVDFAWLFSKKNSRWNYSAGIGLNIFFGDNPKDSRDYDACLGIRFPLGIEFLVSDHISIGLECAPFFQILPPFAFRPYVIDQNAGLVFRYSF